MATTPAAPDQPDESNLADLLAQLTEEERAAIWADFTDAEKEALQYEWRVWARRKQLPPDGDWWGWLLVAGRGFGKNRAGAQFVDEEARSGRAMRIGLIARTAADVRDVMVEGESGVLNICHPRRRPIWEPTKRRLTWAGGAVGTVYTADEPDLLRGPQHDLIWADEVSTWRFREAWDNAMMGLRLGTSRWLATMTPKPVPLVKELLRDAATDPAKIRLVTGSTYENKDNLSPQYIENVVKKYEGTRLGMQELYARLLEDNPDALWKRKTIDTYRVKEAPHLRVVGVGVDPSATSKDTSAETGIIVAGLGDDGHGYVLDDVTLRGKPHEWATAVVSAYERLQGNFVAAEVNHGGDMVIATILNVDARVPVRRMVASRGKAVRAEPIALLYEQGKVHHVGTFAELEDEQCTWSPMDAGPSPDRMDALVWILSELMVHLKDKRYGRDYGIY